MEKFIEATRNAFYFHLSLNLFAFLLILSYVPVEALQEQRKDKIDYLKEIIEQENKLIKEENEKAIETRRQEDQAIAKKIAPLRAQINKAQRELARIDKIKLEEETRYTRHLEHFTSEEKKFRNRVRTLSRQIAALNNERSDAIVSQKQVNVTLLQQEIDSLNKKHLLTEKYGNEEKFELQNIPIEMRLLRTALPLVTLGGFLFFLSQWSRWTGMLNTAHTNEVKQYLDEIYKTPFLGTATAGANADLPETTVFFLTTFPLKHAGFLSTFLLQGYFLYTFSDGSGLLGRGTTIASITTALATLFTALFYLHHYFTFFKKTQS
jgi:hypothetical protein